MDHLLKRINKPKGDMIGHVAKMHAVFEAIHPFGDGNGRVGRLVMAIHLINAGYPPPAIENRRKADYYDALEAAQMRSDTHLTIFLTECLQKSYEIFKKHRR
jgi:Fic family protein